MFETRINEWRKVIESLPPDMAILPSPPDPRDYAEPLLAVPLPDRVNLPVHRVLDQGLTPFCGGASGAGAAGGFYKKHFSMTFLYWLCKLYDGIPDQPGTYLRTVCKILQKYGITPEDMMPFSNVSKPLITGLEEAKQFRARAYYRVRTAYEMKTALCRGHYLIIGTLITAQNWGWRNGGWISKPAGEFRGGHATLIYGYDDNISQDYNGYFLGVNSWGKNWGAGGKFYLPYDYLNFQYGGVPKFLEAWSLEFEPVKAKVNPWLNYRDLVRAKRMLRM